MRGSRAIGGLAIAAVIMVFLGGWALHRAVAGQGMSIPPASVDLSQYPTRAEMSAAINAVPTYTDAQAKSAAPVQAVNGAMGSVTIPTVQRQVSTPIDISSGTATWTYPVPFKNAPTCWPTVGPSNASYVFAQPTISATLTAATVNEQAALKALTLPLGLTTVWVNPPAGTTITLSCVGALP